MPCKWYLSCSFVWCHASGICPIWTHGCKSVPECCRPSPKFEVKYLNLLLIVWVFALHWCSGQLTNIPQTSVWALLHHCLKEITTLWSSLLYHVQLWVFVLVFFPRFLSFKCIWNVQSTVSGPKQSKTKCCLRWTLVLPSQLPDIPNTVGIKK